MNKRLKELEKLCIQSINASKKESEELLKFYKEEREKGNRGLCFSDFEDFKPRFAKNRKKSFEDLRKFGVDFNISDGYLDEGSILHIINLIK